MSENIQKPPFWSNEGEEICRRGANRCFVQQKLYEIYFKPDGISYEDSQLRRLHEDREIVDSWKLKDHNEAVNLIKLAKNDLDAFKAYLPTMNLHVIYSNTLESIRKCYKQIMDYYEATGFLEELTTYI